MDMAKRLAGQEEKKEGVGGGFLGEFASCFSLPRRAYIPVVFRYVLRDR